MPKKQDDIKQEEINFFDIPTPRLVTLKLKMEGQSDGDMTFLVLFNGQVIVQCKWDDGLTLEQTTLPVNLVDKKHHDILADSPIIIILRNGLLRSAKESDPLMCVDNWAGASVDLLPLLLGEKEVLTTVHLIALDTGRFVEFNVKVHAQRDFCSAETRGNRIPLMITMLSAHCLPILKEGTACIAAISLDGILEGNAVQFGMSLSNSGSTKTKWACASIGGLAANTAYDVPNDDTFVPEDLEIKTNNDTCYSFYWYAMKRLLVDPNKLIERLRSPFFVEVASVPGTGKMEVRGRYMGFVDAAAMLQPGQFGISIYSKLLLYNEMQLPESFSALLDLPPTSAKGQAPVGNRVDFVLDAFGHNAYIAVRFDLIEPLTPRANLSTLYEILGFVAPENSPGPVDELIKVPVPDDPNVDVKRIRKEGGALAVHKELSSVACRGSVQMNQSIKRTAANRVLARVRSMLKQFAPVEECSTRQWQELVTAQHAAARRAVTASFAPQAPPLRTAPRTAAARARMAGDTRVAAHYTENNLKIRPEHPRILLSKVLRCLEERNDTVAKSYLMDALKIQPKNRYLLWTMGGQEFDKGDDAFKAAGAAFRLAAKGDHSNGTNNAIGWAALHSLHHYNGNPYAAFVAVKKMRKSDELSKEWKIFLQNWIDTSGEEETYWMPGAINPENPIMMAAAFFLCLRCYKFSERLLKCVERECTTRGSRLNLKYEITPDLYYLRTVSLLLRNLHDKALEMTEKAIEKVGPCPLLSQIRATCLALGGGGWSPARELALQEADRACAEVPPALLLQAAMGQINTNPKMALQRAARAHQLNPNAYAALAIARIYLKLGEEWLAERWAVSAVKSEPLLADAWAVLALLAAGARDAARARHMLRTARQAGPVAVDLDDELRRLADVVHIDMLPEALVKGICFCEYY